MVEEGFEWIHRYGYLGIFLLLLLGIVGLPIPDETLLLFVGYLSFKDELSGPLALVSAVLGSGCGITISYGLGRVLGPRVRTALGPWLHLTDDRYRVVQEWVSQWGKYALLLAYFVPLLRHLVALVVGASKLPFLAFALPAYLGAFFWSATFITIGYILGEEWVTLSQRFHGTFVWMVVGLLTFVGLVVFAIRSRLIWSRKN